MATGCRQDCLHSHFGRQISHLCSLTLLRPEFCCGSPDMQVTPKLVSHGTVPCLPSSTGPSLGDMLDLEQEKVMRVDNFNFAKL